MARRIKGITIELDGETRGLDKALSDVNKRSKDLQKELRDVDRLLKFNPGNVELVAQKQKLLGEQVDATRNKLNRLKEAEKQVQDQFARGKISEEQYRAFQREIAETESKLKHFESQLADTQSSLEKFGDSIGETGEKFKKTGEKMTTVGKDLSKKVTAPIVGIGAVAAKVGSDFEAGMSRVQAISGATGDELEALTEQARELGATTRFSASDAATGMEFLAMAGFETNEIMASMPGLLDLAASSGMDLGRAADIASNILSGFGMEAGEAGRVADVLAKGASTANTNVEQLGGAMKYVAPVASSLGLEVEGLTAAVGFMSDAGIQGEQAGRQLRQGLLRLANPTGKAAGIIEELGIKAFNADGTMKDLDEVVGELEKGLGGMNDQTRAATLATLFGAESVAGWTTLIQRGSKDLNSYTKELEGAEGAAAEMAAVMQDNLQGRLTEMKSALEEAAISIYDNLKPALEFIVSLIKQLADWFNNLSPAIQNTIFIIGTIAAAIGPVLIVLGMLISSIGSIMTVVGPVIAGIGKLGGVIALLTNPITLIIAIVSALIAVLVALYRNNEEFRDKVQDIWASIQEFFQTALTFIIDIVTKVMNDVVAFFSVQLTKIRDFWRENGEGIINLVKQYFDLVWTYIKFVMNQIKAVFQIVWPVIYHAVRIAWEYIKMFVSNGIDLVLGIIKTVMKLIQGDWKGAWETIKQTAHNIMDNIVNFFKRIDLWRVGKDIIQGLINGIKSMIGNVKSTVSSIAKNIPDWTKKILGIRSPSKVFEQIGEWTGEGLAEGMDATARQIRNASERMAEMSIPTISKESSIAINSQGSTNHSSQRPVVIEIPVYLDSELIGRGVSGVIDSIQGDSIKTKVLLEGGGV